MSTTDHKRAFRAPTDNDGGFYVHPNSLDDITLSNGTPGLQRIVATNQASAIGPYILRGLNVSGTSVMAGEAVFKSGGIVSVVETTLAAIGGSGNYIYLSNTGVLSRSATLTKSDTSLLIDYYDTSWHCTKEDAGIVTLGAKDLNVIGNTNTASGTLITYKIGTDVSGTRCITLKNGDSLSDAITSLDGAGTIILLPGTYTGGITTSGNVSILGINKSACIVSGNITFGRTGTIDQVSVNGGIDIKYSDCTVSNCIIDGGLSGSVARGIYVRGGIENCKIINNIVKNVSSTTAYGISSLGSYSLVKGNTIQNITGTSGSYGIYLTDWSRVTDNYVYDISCGSGTPAYGIAQVSGNSSIISNNFVYTVSGGGTGTQYSAGIYLFSVSGCTITGNVVRSISANTTAGHSYGIYLFATSICSVTGNTGITITGHAGDNIGIYCTGGSENVVVANNFSVEGVTVNGTNDISEHNNV